MAGTATGQDEQADLGRIPCFSWESNSTAMFGEMALLTCWEKPTGPRRKERYSLKSKTKLAIPVTSGFRQCLVEWRDVATHFSNAMTSDRPTP